MTKVCKRHTDNPVKIYHQCVGCELEWFREELEQKQQEIERLREENEGRKKIIEAYMRIEHDLAEDAERYLQQRDKLIEGLRWYAKLNPAYTGHRARDILHEIGVTVE